MDKTKVTILSRDCEIYGAQPINPDNPYIITIFLTINCTYGSMFDPFCTSIFNILYLVF